MTNPSRLEQMFCAVLEKTSFAERVAYLDEACRDDPDLRRQVSRLLQAHHAAGDFLETPGHMLDGTFPTSRILSETVGARIGPYTLVQELGEGGMGTVFLAEQDSPVKRRVALKILKPGLDSRQVLRRFDAERHSLALMDHPNIAKVLDAGVTPLGRPYFVMELVSGIPIGKYCDEHRLPIRDRLELFVSVCHAIQHAHQKGIIHRDVKPSNVLICVHEGQATATATAKVIDFGVAKVLFQQLSGDSVHTEIGQIIGTLEYMSPEQAGLSDLDIDTRADIYSLGVLLYELLTGGTPLDRRALPGVPLTELLRMIREVEPPKPSSRLAQSETYHPPQELLIAALPSLDRPGRRRGASNATDAARPSPMERVPRSPPTTGTVERRFLLVTRSVSEVRNLQKQIRGELDWIVMKCLEIDRTRRYETAVALAQDIERHLNDEPVAVGPPSNIYRFRKLIRRHKGPVLAVSVILLSLVGGIIGTSWGLVQARASTAAMSSSNRRLDAANQKLSAANVNLSRSREETEQKRQDAEREKAIALSVNEFMQELLSQADSDTQGNQGFKPDPNLTVKEALSRAAARIGERFQDQPRLEAATRQTIGAALWKTGESEAAIPHLERARALWEAQDNAEDNRLHCVIDLALAYQDAGQWSRSLALQELTVSEAEKHRGPDHDLTLTSMNNLATTYTRMGKFDKAVALLETIGERHVQHYGPDAKQTLNVLGNLAVNYESMGQLDKAMPLMEQLASRGDLTAMNNLVQAYMHAGQPEKALPLSERVVTQTRDRWGSDHPLTLTAMNGLTTVYYGMLQYDKALSLCGEVLALREKMLGADHPDTLVSTGNLALLYDVTGQSEKALPLTEHVVQKQKELFGQDHPDTLLCMCRLASVYCKLHRESDGIALYEQAIALTEKKFGPDHPIRSMAMHDLGVVYVKSGQSEKAIPLLESVVNPGTKTILSIALAYSQTGQVEKAEQILDACLTRLRRQGPAGNSDVSNALATEPAPPVLTIVTIADASDLPNVLATLATFQLAQKKYVEAEPVLRECLAKRSETAPDAWTTFNSQSLLGEALLGQQKYAEAEPLLIAGYEGMKQRDATVPPEAKSRLPMALARLVRLYEAWGKPDEVAKWRQEIDAASSPTADR